MNKPSKVIQFPRHRKSRKPRIIGLPSRFWLRNDLSPSELVLLVHIKRLSKQGILIIKMKDLAAHAHISRSTIFRCLPVLIAKHLISVATRFKDNWQIPSVIATNF